MAGKPRPRLAPEPLPVEGCRWIPLTKGRFTLVADFDYEKVARFNWTFLSSGRGYAIRAVQENGKRVYYLMHRVLMDAPPDMEVDHQDGDSLNNRRGNLRLCTHKKNRGNTRKHKDNKSGFKGVCWNKNAQKWQGSAMGTYLGLFEDKEDAARAYDEAAKRIVGPFANLNFPEAA